MQEIFRAVEAALMYVAAVATLFAFFPFWPLGFILYVQWLKEPALPVSVIA